ncbi:MAG TPA: enoyl-CoA hydratase, partial [Gammaproteobacteria bacterium]|nr:enoyl-CoA hydratase [Gammaproteobacteria bacterium]
MSGELVLCARDASIAEVTLNRPEVMNALSVDLRAELIATFHNLAEDSSCEIVILTGAGRAFTAGLDLKELGGETDSGNNTTDSSVTELSDALAMLKVPLIGAINGFAITGGFELALMCDILIASSNARFADTHARVGVVPGWGLSQRLPRIVGINRAKELSLSGNFLDAETAYDWGLVNRVVD